VSTVTKVWRDIRSHAATRSAVVVIKFIAKSYRTWRAVSRAEMEAKFAVQRW
jgi:hypothetical protein